MANHIPESKARAYLGQFNFNNDRVFEPISNFSGGEKARLIMSFIIYEQPNLILLDEPTNHLDLETREALVDALQTFDGAVVVVSHDRYLLNTVVDEFWLVSNGGVKRFDGTIDDYRNWFFENNLAEVADKKPKINQGKLLKQQQKFERELKRANDRIQNLDTQMADPDLFANDQARFNRLAVEAKTLRQKVASIEEDILKIMEQLD